MKTIIMIMFIFILSIGQDDPRMYNHGACIVEFYNNQTNYYLTWSSAANYAWEHNIYNSTIHFDIDGNLITNTQNQLFIGSQWDESQEPVNSTINSDNNYIITVWEDGSDADAPNVRGQLHNADGTIIRSNWIIAGGSGSQHSAQVAYLSNKYAVFYADEAPPATNGAVVKAKIIDHLTGNETQTITFTPNDEDHWWPITVSNDSDSRTLIIWGNDGYSIMGTVLFDNNGVISQTKSPLNYLINTQQYYYHVVWLENISRFLIVARKGAYENITDSSMVCIIDTLGNMSTSKTINGGIIREAKMAKKWDQNSQKYHIFYPSGTNSLTHFTIDSIRNISPTSTQITDHPDLIDYQWATTGIWSTFVKDINQNDEWNDKHIALFIMNDTSSNDIIKIPVHLSTSLFNNTSITTHPSSISEKININFFSNLIKDNLIVKLNNISNNNKVTISIFKTSGQKIFQKEIDVLENKVNLDISKFPVGYYFYRLKL